MYIPPHTPPEAASIVTGVFKDTNLTETSQIRSPNLAVKSTLGYYITFYMHCTLYSVMKTSTLVYVLEPNFLSISLLNYLIYKQVQHRPADEVLSKGKGISPTEKHRRDITSQSKAASKFCTNKLNGNKKEN